MQKTRDIVAHFECLIKNLANSLRHKTVIKLKTILCRAMEHRDGRPRASRREIHSVCMPVPVIILENSEKTDYVVLPHSRSAGDLDMALADVGDYEPEGIDNTNQRNVNTIGLSCSPRLPRRLAKTSDEQSPKQSGSCFDSFNPSYMKSLDPGSHVGSTVSLTSEYTPRSVGLISNDSNSECSQQGYITGMKDCSVQKHSVLKRFYSTPETDDEMLNCAPSVRRDSKSMGNIKRNSVSCDFGSDSTTDESFQQMCDPRCDIDDSLARRTGYNVEGASSDSQSERNLVTAVTGGSTLRDGRIQKWLTEISVQDENSNS